MTTPAPTVITYVKLYTMFDIVALARTGSIIQCPNDEVARRSFTQLLSDKDMPVPANDLELIYIGTLDSLGHLTGTDIQVIARGIDIIHANSPEVRLNGAPGPEIVK